jgi:hypothetical protein
MGVDFPRAWQIARATPVDNHDPKCSYRVMNGGLLCDCDVLNKHPEAVDDILQGAEPDPLDATLECPDCDGTGEVQVTVAAGYFGWEGQDSVDEECEACHGSGTLRLGDLEK